MTKVITNGELKNPDFPVYVDGDTQGTIVPMELFLGLEDNSNTGVWLDSHEEVEEIADNVKDIPVIALNFPVFTDGRAYSSASILRKKYGYEGELRAIGDVRVDQLDQMKRCGFDSFELNETQDAEKAMGALLGSFSHNYQATAQHAALFEIR